uniref:PQQ-dependent sugar dehydrogenase n=1 Tax=Herbidospora sakaeratensis TaxID=564415 RepID=UPI0007864DFF|nr:PQQ-dependent sugar dehydrogenase [Herbidospora sakaeratensis]
MGVGRTGLLTLAAALTVGCTAACTTETGVGTGVTPTPLAATATASPAPADGPRTLVEGLEVPWAIAFLPTGEALVTERDSGQIVQVAASGRKTEIGTVAGVAASGEGGLMGIAVSPEFERDKQVFVYFTSAQDNRIVRYRFDGALSDPEPIVTGIPKGGIHNGGRLAFGPDGYLYASTGEIGDRGLSQDRDSLAGKILRMTVDGEPAPENPFGTLVWSMGHRNVQGLAWDESGNMYATEFGQNTFDELNLIRAGGNYGWPEVEGVAADDRFVNPLVTWSTDEASPSGLAYADHAVWAAALRGERLWKVPVTPDGAAGRPEALYEGEFGRLRSVATAPDGSLWVGTSNRDGRGDPKNGDDRVLVIPGR